VREATKQSSRAWVPEVSPLVSAKQLATLAASAQVIVLDPLSQTPLSQLPLSQFAPTSARVDIAEKDSRDIVLVVGPEGGIAASELELLYGAGAVGARLGDGILRTSTAGPAAIAVLSAKLRNW
jgi:16S rRNA (uracil1498-N3)-methyltransferase